MDQLNSTTATSNVSSPGPQPSWNSSGLYPTVILSVFILLGVPGNIAVIILRPNWEHLSSLSQSLLLNLAVSDLLCLLALVPWIYTFLYGWTFGLAACKLLTYLEYCTLYGSLLTATGLSIHRYFVVVRRQRFQQVRRRLVLVVLWLVACILSIPSLVVREVEAGQWKDCQEQYVSEAQRLAVRLTETAFGFIFFTTVAFSYIRLRRTVTQAAFFNHQQTTWLVSSLILSLFILWAPYHTINVLSVAAIFLKNESLLEFCNNALFTAAAVTFVNCWLNPLLYAFSSYNLCKRKEPDINTAAQLP